MVCCSKRRRQQQVYQQAPCSVGFLKILLRYQEPCWAALHGISGELNAAVQAKRPTHLRKYDYDRGTWIIHRCWINWLVQTAEADGHKVDCSDLPSTWNVDSKTSTSLQSCYDILNITNNASIALVKMAYKIRASECHPDKGFSSEKFLELQEAYQKILMQKASGKR